MKVKCFRRWSAWIAVVAVAFGQFALTAYACPLQGIAPAVAAERGAANDAERSGPCADMDEAPAGAQGNACEIHCTDGIVTGMQPDLPPVALNALPEPAIAVAGPRTSEGHRMAVVPISRAPPLTLQFCRLLI